MPIAEPVELLICDLDGTLVDSKYDLAAAVNHALSNLGFPTLEITAFPPLLGSGLSYLLRTVLQTTDEATLSQGRALFDAYYRQHVADFTRCYPGVLETLQKLPLQKAIYSNKAQWFTDAVVDALGLRPHFSFILGAQPERFPLKPDPAGIHLILEELAISPLRAVMIGDSTHDLEAGRAAGLRVGAVTYGYRPVEVLRQHHPDFLIDHFAELQQLL